jgi:hypothetical protein
MRSMVSCLVLLGGIVGATTASAQNTTAPAVASADLTGFPEALTSCVLSSGAGGRDSLAARGRNVHGLRDTEARSSRGHGRCGNAPEISVLSDGEGAFSVISQAVSSCTTA